MRKEYNEKKLFSVHTPSILYGVPPPNSAHEFLWTNNYIVWMEMCLLAIENCNE
jgi:hypothetical protein